MTAAYGEIRIAFGTPIGGYQGVKHKDGDTLVDVESAKSLTFYAGWAIDEAPLAASMAKVYASVGCHPQGRRRRHPVVWHNGARPVAASE